jgi:hypothetical protein
MTAPNNGATGPTRAANADRANADAPMAGRRSERRRPFPSHRHVSVVQKLREGTKDAYHSAEAPKFKTRLMITSLSRTI